MIKISLVQSSLHWENPEANRNMFDARIDALAGNTDLILLPEMFSTGFSMNAGALAEPMDGPTATWIMEKARQCGAAVAGSFICRENGRFYNRLLWAFPDGKYQIYDKRHLFGLAGEDGVYTAGARRSILEWKGFRICPLICYDLRFPAWSRNARAPEEAYDLLIYIANWPERRIHHWKTLLMARAIENQCFVAGLNIVGVDGTGLKYVGASAIIDFSGQAICEINDREETGSAVLSLADLQAYRRQLPFLQDGDSFVLN